VAINERFIEKTTDLLSGSIRIQLLFNS